MKRLIELTIGIIVLLLVISPFLITLQLSSVGIITVPYSIFFELVLPSVLLGLIPFFIGPVICYFTLVNYYQTLKYGTLWQGFTQNRPYYEIIIGIKYADILTGWSIGLCLIVNLLINIIIIYYIIKKVKKQWYQ